jgi:competence protein ComEC
VLRVHFLNVGHGDCTIIKHHSGRLTMVDINTSQDYDKASFSDLVTEEAQRLSKNSLSLVSAFGGGLGVGGGIGGGFPGSINSLLGPPVGYFEALAKVKTELTDPITFSQNHLSGREALAVILTHPGLDHMRGLKRLHETIGFGTFWDTAHTKPTPRLLER